MEFVCADAAYLSEEERVIPPLLTKGNAAQKHWTGVVLLKYGVLNGSYSALLDCVKKYHPEVTQRGGS